jgi:hypothetical protein
MSDSIGMGVCVDGSAATDLVHVPFDIAVNTVLYWRSWVLMLLNNDFSLGVCWVCFFLTLVYL